MNIDHLRDDRWDRSKGFMPGGTKRRRGPRINNGLISLQRRRI